MKVYVVFDNGDFVIQNAREDFNGRWVATYLNRQEIPILVVNPIYDKAEFRDTIIDLINEKLEKDGLVDN